MMDDGCNVFVSQVLGTPTREEIKCMNPNYTEFKFPQIKAHPWHKVLGIINQFFYVNQKRRDMFCFTLFNHNIWLFPHLQIFPKRMPPEAVDLVSRLLQYSPNLRCTAVSKRILFSNCPSLLVLHHFCFRS